MASPPWLDAAASFATCQTLTSAGGALVGTGVATMAAGGSGLVPLSLGMLSLLGAGAVCQGTPVDGQGDPAQVDGCYAMEAGGVAWLQIRESSGNAFTDINDVRYPDADKTTRIDTTTITNVGGGTPWEVRVKYETTVGPREGYTLKATEDAAREVTYRLRPITGSCGTEIGDPQPYPPDFNDPIPYTDPNTSCTYNIYPQGFVQETDGGGAGFVMKIEAAPATTRASGGVVGGCNFEPTLVYQPPGGGPPTTIPWNPTWPDWDGSGIPPWLATLIGAAGGVGGTIITNLISQLFETKYPEGTREIYAACNYKQNGSPETFSVTFPEENYQNRVLTSLDAIVDFQQQILLWRTPTCSGGGSSVSGDPVTLNWVSDEYSSAGGNRIRKLLTYFDQVGSTLEQTVAHWRDFTWQAGPVIVSVNDVPLGKPQVWASSEAEGKRVINHAAAIAGVDMTNASWLITSPRSSRYGETGTMRIHRSRNGTLGITKRDGPSGLPPALT